MLLIFDWDGTLADSELHIVSALQQASAESGLDTPTHASCARLIGLGLTDAARHLHPELDATQVKNFCATYSRRFIALENEGHRLRLFHGAEQVLEKLLNQGHHLAVATGKSRRGLDRALDTSGLRPMFCATATADETASKPSPAMLHALLEQTGTSVEAAVMIGDTSFDMKMAQAARMRRVAATYGVHELSELEQFSPDWLIENPAQLLAWPALH
ncbi:MAG: HAD-IA family hydrolase, partial [Pseudomonadales bacterium]|nr:HAD-IA family hydrolase [Pseudomonadales bacterium]